MSAVFCAPAVDGDLELSPAGQEELGDTLPLVDIEEDALPVVPRGQQAVDSVRREGNLT